MEDCDVLVIGAGLAGMSAVVGAAKHGLGQRVVLASPSAYDGGCGRETHALNAAVAPGDSWMEHYRDTMFGSGLIANPRLVATLCSEAVREVGDLERMGVRFDSAMDGEHDLGSYGGSTHARAVHRADLTGLDIMNTRLRQAISEGVTLLNGLWMVELMVEEGRCLGAVFFDATTSALCTIKAKSTVLATGGGACVYPISTISADKAASGVTSAMRNGLSCVDLEMVQFHPTGLAAPARPGHGALVEEEMRTLGATLHNASGERFMDAYDKRGERATRDVVSRACFTEISKGRGTTAGAVILDISPVRCDSLLERFPNSVRRLRAAGVDLLTQKQIETCPSAHFLMGGVEIDEHACTSAEGLYACGEDAGGVHGGNRLGGNGIIDALVFGRIAGESAARSALVTSAPSAHATVRVTLHDLPAPQIAEMDGRLRKLMWRNGGLARDQGGMSEALAEVTAMREEVNRNAVSIESQGSADAQLLGGHALADRLLLAAGILTSALERPTSLAAHNRTDDAGKESPVAAYSVAVRLTDDALTAYRVPRPPARPHMPASDRLAA